jgi:nickel-type superoxide dismutase maturation protease
MRIAVTTFAVAFVVARLLAARFPVGRYVVEGPSMEPAYRGGDRVLVNRLAYIRCSPAVGDVVVLRDPERRGRHLLKRIAPPTPDAAIGKDRYFVQGDNTTASRDSRAFGPIPRRAIIGKAWRKY